MNELATVLTSTDLAPAAAEAFVAAAACAILLVDAFLPERRRGWTFLLTIAALAGASWVTSLVATPDRSVVLYGHFVADPMGTVLKLFTYGAAAVALLYSRDYLARRGLMRG